MTYQVNAKSRGNMQNVKSNETIDDFIANLPKESIFMRRSRLSISSKVNDAKRINNGNITFCKEKEDDVRPLTDVSNQSEKTLKTRFAVAREIENKGGVICSKEVIPKGIASQIWFQKDSTNRFSQRRSLAIPPRIQPICLSSKKNTPTRSYSASKSPRRPLLASRLKDPPTRGKVEKIKLKRIMCYSEQENHPPPTLAFKSPNIVSLSARRKRLAGVFSSTKKIHPFVKRNVGDNLNTTKVLKPQVEQECCRTLQFQESQETNDEEFTKPLPLIDLNSSKTDGSMLHGLKRATDSEHTRVALRNEKSLSKDPLSVSCTETKVTKGDTFIASNSSSTLPVRNDRRKSSIPVFKRDLSSKISSSPLENIAEPSISNKSKRRETLMLNKSKNTFARLSRENLAVEPLPEIKVLPCTPVSESDASLDSCSQVTPLQGEGDPLHTVEDDGKSPPPPPNSPSCDNKEGKKMSTIVLPETIDIMNPHSCKDASTNTVLSAALFQGPHLHTEKLVEEALAQQEKIENEFETLVQEFSRKSEILMLQYKATFQPFKELRKQFAEKLNIQGSINEATLSERTAVHFEVDENSKEDEHKEDHKLRMALKYRFLGTPLPRKSKNRLSRSFSHPQSLEELAALQSPEFKLPDPVNGENSFHSVQSDYSPFTTCVGDCERPSLAPMTPLTRHNVTLLKQSMNKQLQNLFE